MKEVQAWIDISSSADRVWGILVDFKNYQAWNPFIHRIEGKAAEGEKLAISIRTPGGKNRSYTPIVRTVIAGSELRWQGRSLLLSGEHVFTLEATAPAATRLVQREIFSGPLSYFLGRNALGDIEAGFEQMNISLKKRVEHD